MARNTYTAAMHEFIVNNADNRSNKELAELFNKEFGCCNATENTMRFYISNHKIKRIKAKTTRGTSIFSDEIRTFIFENVKGLSNHELTEMVNQKYKTSYEVSQIKSFKKNNCLSSGLDGRFVKGQVPPNKGKKGYYAPGCEKGWFKKGQAPVNHRPVGSERIDSQDGYTLVKVAESTKWKLKHKHIWELHNGPVPKNHVVIFLDGDRSNLDINNLGLISRSELLIMNRKKLISSDANLTKTGVLIARVLDSGSKASKRLKVK